MTNKQAFADHMRTTDLPEDRERNPIELMFVNSDATPKFATVRCDAASIAAIMAWYGAYYAGDRYAVYADGVKLVKDKNGEPA